MLQMKIKTDRALTAANREQRVVLTRSNDAEGEFVFGEDKALTWGNVASAGVNDPRHYTRRNTSASARRALLDESDEDLIDEDDIVDLGNDGEIGNENLNDHSK
ncbi:hypothetical protein Tco_0730217 [Tanacetum coccineum]|uniref:Uncharacterized protein n=1 Tax=Tanacetum coccineum TaxID=301880 RepID=A0ABQ4YSD1_9ASTR